VPVGANRLRKSDPGAASLLAGTRLDPRAQLEPDGYREQQHATARPAIPPNNSRLNAKPRTANMVTANLEGVLDVHGASTDKIELRAQWTEPIDDPSASEPTARTTNEVVVDYRIEAAERFSPLTRDANAKHVGARDVHVPFRKAIHTLPYTKARTVTSDCAERAVPRVLRSRRASRGRRLRVVGQGGSVSLWARDPILLSSKIAYYYEVPVFAAWQRGRCS
jgi:hypothetical protein